MGQIANEMAVKLFYKWKKRLKENGRNEDFSEMNHLPAETKQLIVVAQTLVNKTQDTLHDKNYYFDMTSKNQLKADCKRVEKLLKAISDGKTDEKTIRELENAVICLRTTLEGVVQFFSR